MTRAGSLEHIVRPDWTTPDVVQFLGISRQAVSKRVRARSLLGYREGRTTRFPAWQFDPENGGVKPVVSELLAVIDESIDARHVANWLRTRHPGLGAPPLTRLLDPVTAPEVLKLAAEDPRLGGAEGQHHLDLVRSPLLKRIRADLGGDDTSPQTAILLAAADLFALHGPAQVSLRSVAATAGVPYSLIYRFYGTKEQLLASVVALLVTYGGRFLSRETDIYEGIANTFGADSGQWWRMIGWAILDGVPPTRLLGEDLRADGYRRQIEALWADPRPPAVRDRFHPRVLATVVALVVGAWAAYEPYATRLAGDDVPSAEEQAVEVIEMLQVLVYACRPSAGPGPDPADGGTPNGS